MTGSYGGGQRQTGSNVSLTVCASTDVLTEFFYSRVPVLVLLKRQKGDK